MAISIFLTPQGRAASWTKVLFSCVLFAIIFWYPWEERRPGADYVLLPDSSTYVGFAGWSDPWLSHRSIGYPAFLYPFLHPEHHKFLNAHSDALKKRINLWADSGKPIYSIATKTGFARKFANIAMAQRFVLALAIAVFYLSLCRWFSPVFSFAALLGVLWLAPPPDPRCILTEPLSCALTWFCATCLLYAQKSSRKALWFALASLCAAFAYLVRPQALSLTALCSLIFLYEILRGTGKSTMATILKTSVAFSPLVLSYLYIGWLSITGGQLFLHTHPMMYYCKFVFFADAEDAQHMPTERAKKFTAWFGEHKEKLINKIKNGQDGYAKINLTEQDSPVQKRRILGNGLAYGPLSEVWRHFKDDAEIWSLRATLRERVNFGKELNSGLLHRHRGEILVNTWQNFLGGLGYYKDVWSLRHAPQISFAINISVLVLLILAMVVSAKIRWPLVVLSGIHLMSILTAALGHHMLSRYVQPTEGFLLLAGLCSLYAMCSLASAHFRQDTCTS